MPILKDEKVPVSQCSAESNCSRHINSLQHIGIEKSNGVCSPALNRSFDSGIVMDDNSLYLHKQIQQCKIILSVLERDKELYKNLRIRLSKIAENRKRKQFLNKVICHICSTDIDINNTESNVRCNYCHMVVCTTKNCAELKAKISGWECKQCSASKESLENTSSWVAEQLLFKERIHLHPMRARSEIYIPINNDGDNDTFMQFESVSQVDLPSYLNFMNEDQKIKIRKYVEELISQILGLPLSRVQLGQISKSEEYLPVINSRKINARTQNDKNNENFEISQERLQQLIETVIAQTLNSSSSNITSDKSQKNLIDNSTQNDIISENGIQSGTASKTYEELLSKAIMNKIATSKNLDCLSVVNTLNIDINSNIENQSTTSGSSLEPKTESSLTDNELDFTNDDLENLSSELKTNLSKYVAAHTIALPDILMEPSESEDDDYTSVCSTNIGEGNWLFKKKRCSVNAGSSCATILVPDPKEHVSAQIGDKTADEISDLSELGSDTDNSIELFQSDLYANNRLLNKHVIGGQNTTAWFEESPDTTSHISFTSASQDDLHFNETVNKTFRQQYVNPTEVVNTDIILSQKDNVPFTGSIAEREYKKWNNAVEMPNNPYAPDALKRRISGSQERFIDIPNISPSTEQNAIDLIKKDTETPDTITKEDEIFEKYSRDYYINKTNQAKQCEKDITPIGEQVDETTIINEPLQNEEGNSDVFQAIPAQVIEETTSLDSQQSYPSVLSSISDDSDTVRTFDFKNEETKIVRNMKPVLEKSATEPLTKKRPNVLEVSNNTVITQSATTSTVRGSTPVAFKFLQPKRKILEPGQVLSFEDNVTEEIIIVPEKNVVEHEVVQVMPSVKALAQAFLLTSSKTTQAQRRWSTYKPHSAPCNRRRTSLSTEFLDSGVPLTESTGKIPKALTPTANSSNFSVECAALSLPESSDDTDGNNPARSADLKNNIAFFENLKNK